MQATNAAGSRQWRDTVRKVEERGSSEIEYAAMGLDFGRVERRIAKLAEVVSLIRAHWDGDELGFSRHFVQVHGYAGRLAAGATATSADHDRVRARRRRQPLRGSRRGKFPYLTAITDDPETALDGLGKTTGIPADLLRNHPNVLDGSVDSVVGQPY